MVQIIKIGSEETAAAIKDYDGYCICAVGKTPDPKCMCKEFREQEETGVCHCGLYKKIVSEDWLFKKYMI